MACITVFILLRAAVVFVIPNAEPTSDAAWYFAKGSDIAAGLGYRDAGSPTAFWPIGYPAFLGALFSITGQSLGAALAANLVLSVVAFLVLYDLAARLSGSERVARMTILFYTLYPNAIGYVGLVLTETLFVTLLLTACWLMGRFPGVVGAVASGVAFGVATLVKTQTVLIPVGLILFGLLFLRAGKPFWPAFGRGLILIFAMLATILPWTVRNHLTFGEFVFVSTNGGVSLLAGNNRHLTPDYVRDYAFPDDLAKTVGHPHEHEIEVNKAAKKLAVDWITQHPDEFLALIPHKLWRLWAPDGESEWGYQTLGASYDDNRFAFRAVRYLNQGFYALILVGVLVFPWVYWKHSTGSVSGWIWLGYLLAAYVSLIAVVFSGQSRYHFPVMPFFMINAAFVLNHLIRVSRGNGVARLGQTVRG